MNQKTPFKSRCETRTLRNTAGILTASRARIQSRARVACSRVYGRRTRFSPYRPPVSMHASMKETRIRWNRTSWKCVGSCAEWPQRKRWPFVVLDTHCVRDASHTDMYTFVAFLRMPRHAHAIKLAGKIVCRLFCSNINRWRNPHVHCIHSRIHTFRGVQQVVDTRKYTRNRFASASKRSETPKIKSAHSSLSSPHSVQFTRPATIDFQN